MSRPPIRLALVGLGKIARDQHVPAIGRDPGFALAATVDPVAGLAGVPTFPTLDALLDRGPPFDAIAICTPPQVRHGLARRALSQAKHVLLEKPPAASLGEVEDLRAVAQTNGCTVFAAWHSRFAAAVAPARAWLGERRVRSGQLSWKEDVRVWHPGQDWIWEAGGLGVFDAGINGLSILTTLVRGPLRLLGAELRVPGNRQAPAAAAVELATHDGAPISGQFDFLHRGPPEWDIALETDAGRLLLSAGGARWSLDGAAQASGDPGEYASVYRRFADLIESGASDLDGAPLQLVADAFLRGERTVLPPFEWI
jgi:D-galactose 1-dehydrogenase